MTGFTPDAQDEGRLDLERRLAAILALDVVGFSRMTGLDEEGTLAALMAHRRHLIDPALAAARGRIIKTMGDGLLAEFSSSVAAVRCAVAIQQGMTERNAHLPGDKRMALRIGVHVGDVVVDGTDLLGDGVNIAARLEGVAAPGGVAVSEDVWRQVQGKVGASFVDAGEVRLKNIADPMRVYTLQVGGPAPAPAPLAPPPPPDRPSIAVLPFQNISGDPEQEYFADGITEDVVTDLSKIGGLLVIARNSSFAYKGRAVDVRTVARELGVGCVLEGSIRRAGDRVRITAQLIDAASGAHLWAERFDRQMSDIFAVQDEVTRQIVDALKIKLTPRDVARLGGVETTSSRAHDLFLAGREVLFAPQRNRETFERSLDILEKATSEDPGYGDPHAGLAFAHLLNWQHHWTDGWRHALESAGRHIGLALDKSPGSAFVHYIAAIFHFWNKDLDRSIAEADQALEISPNHANVLSTRSLARIYGGQPLAAIPDIEQALRLDPATKHFYLHFLGSAYLLAGDDAKAAAVFRERIQLSPRTDLSRAFLAVALGHLGEAGEARRVWAELMEINPTYVFAEHVGRLPFRDMADVDRLAGGLRKAGIPA